MIVSVWGVAGVVSILVVGVGSVGVGLSTALAVAAVVALFAAVAGGEDYGGDAGEDTEDHVADVDV